MNQVSTDQLMQIIGQKEVELVILRQMVQQLQEENKKLKQDDENWTNTE